MPRRKQQAPKRAAGKRWLRSGCPAPSPAHSGSPCAQRLARPPGPGLAGTPPPGAFQRVSLRVPSSTPHPDLRNPPLSRLPLGGGRKAVPPNLPRFNFSSLHPSTPPLTFSSSLASCLWSQSWIVDLGCKEGRGPPPPLLIPLRGQCWRLLASRERVSSHWSSGLASVRLLQAGCCMQAGFGAVSHEGVALVAKVQKAPPEMSEALNVFSKRIHCL